MTKHGQVYSEKSGKFLALWVNNTGRLLVTLYSKGPVHRQVSRLVLEAFVGACPPGHECDHVNEDFTDNDLSNLRWLPVGRNRSLGNRKLTEDDIHAIRLAHASSATRTSLAPLYGVSRTTISNVIREDYV